MSSTICAFCGRFVHMAPQWAESRPFSDYTQIGTIRGSLIQGIAKCDNCGRASMGVTQAAESSTDPRISFEKAPDSSFTWYPKIGVSPDFPDVPPHIAAAAKEAHASASINSVMAPILMARTVVEATAKSKGITTGFLVAKIDEMATAGFIRADTQEAAHEIRHFGNDMAHGDLEDQPSAEDAEEVLALMDEVLNEVFQGPARTARIKAKRTAPPTNP